MKQNDTNTRHAVGIKWKLFIYLAGFAAFILVILWLCQVVFLKDIYTFIKTTEIKNAASNLSDSVYDISELAKRSDEISKDHEICILAVRINKNNAVKLISCDTNKQCAIHNMSESGIFTLYDSAVRNGGKNIQHFRFDDEIRKYIEIIAGDAGDAPESIIYSIVEKDSDNNDILLILDSVISPVGATVQTLNTLLIIISILMIVLAMFTAVIISRHISRPITDISDAAKLLAKGDYSVRFCGGSYREVNDLANTLNYAESELSKVESLRRELIANTSHDLRTPLTMITGYAEVMRDLPGENTPENAQIIIDESKRLTSLVNDMLDISKLESGNVTVTSEPIDLTDMLIKGMERYRQFKERDGYNIQFIFDNHVSVCTDGSKFMQAFYNIVNNAVTYTGSDKSVTVRQEVYTDPIDMKRWVRVSVTDTGDGIPNDKLAYIWDRYYKVDAAHKRAAQGTGLGLSIVSKIMNYLSGRCGVVSQIGKGSTFWIEIPLDN